MFLNDNQGKLQTFSIFQLWNKFSEKWTPFSKNWSTVLAETTKIENISLSFKTALSEANVMTNKMATIKWTYHKDGRFSVTSLFFGKFVLVLEPLKKS